jgi:3-deoxy-D-manno-octulosonic-acid transferase
LNPNASRSARLAYSALLRVIAPAYVARLWWRGRAEPLYREAIGERFGRYGGAPSSGWLWVHAVSLGETRAAAALIEAVRQRRPDLRLLLTHGTATGREAGRALLREGDRQTWLPYDSPAAVRRFLIHFRPAVGVLMETEIWPNLLARCAADDVPVVLANARMSEKSARGYQRWRALSRPAIGSLAAVCAQSEADAARLRALGAQRVEVTGNLKFDVTLDGAQLAAGREWKAKVGRPVLLLASTREGEEKILLSELKDEAFLTVVVPRHPQRFDDLASISQSRRTRARLPAPGDRVHLGDTMGEMAFYYAACDVAVIGGSFMPLGGQNLIEALAAGAPVVVGPSMFNFTEATRLALEAGAALQAGDAAAAMRQARGLLFDEKKRQSMAAAGRKLCAAHRGATQRHVEVLKVLARG